MIVYVILYIPLVISDYECEIVVSVLCNPKHIKGLIKTSKYIIFHNSIVLTDINIMSICYCRKHIPRHTS